MEVAINIYNCYVNWLEVDQPAGIFLMDRNTMRELSENLWINQISTVNHSYKFEDTRASFKST